MVWKSQGRTDSEDREEKARYSPVTELRTLHAFPLNLKNNPGLQILSSPLNSSES